ncbi:MAG: hypothetical protein WB014_01115 [Methanosarcina sp.]
MGGTDPSTSSPNIRRTEEKYQFFEDIYGKWEKVIVYIKEVVKRD